MKRIYLVVAAILILAATFAIEYYANSQFPTEELVVSEVSVIQLGEPHIYNYLRQDQRVGYYRYTVEESGDDYLLTSETNVNFEDQDLELFSEYVFDGSYKPETYELIVSGGDDDTLISTTVDGDSIVTSVTYQDTTVEIPDAFEPGTFLIEVNMPGFWEVLFTSTDLERGVRYSGSFYTPQGAESFDVNLVVNRQDQRVWVGDERLLCMVVREANFELSFYLYDGELVLMRSDTQDITLEKVIG